MATTDWVSDIVATGVILGPWPVLGGFVTALMKGWLVPSRTADLAYNRVLDELNRSRKEAETWREAYIAARQARQTLVEAVDEIFKTPPPEEETV